MLDVHLRFGKTQSFLSSALIFLGIILEMELVYFPQDVELLFKASALCPARFLFSFWQPKSHVLFS